MIKVRSLRLPKRLLLRRLSSGIQGETCAGESVVHVDPTRMNVGHTLYHELLHFNHPEWSENKVQRETARFWRAASWREKAALLRLFGKAR